MRSIVSIIGSLVNIIMEYILNSIINSIYNLFIDEQLMYSEIVQEEVFRRYFKCNIR